MLPVPYHVPARRIQVAEAVVKEYPVGLKDDTNVRLFLLKSHALCLVQVATLAPKLVDQSPYCIVISTVVQRLIGAIIANRAVRADSSNILAHVSTL